MILPDKRLTGVGKKFGGHVPENRNAELKFFCRVSLLDNSAHYVLSQTVKIIVKTGEPFLPMTVHI